MRHPFVALLTTAALLALFSAAGLAAPNGEAAPCQRPAAGSKVKRPPDLYSRDGRLEVSLEYRTTLDADDRTLFCFQTPDGAESPTLHVRPGDTLDISLTNKVPALPAGLSSGAMSIASDVFCGASTMDATSVNMHFHGTNTRPVCHSDGVVHTLVNSGQTFRYSVEFPRDEPPGVYWYHPHVHGFAEAAVEGGATGLIVVEGIENLQPEVARLPERLLVVRDQLVKGYDPVKPRPDWDVTLNYVPIPYPQLTPSVIDVRTKRREFWRVANTSADTTLDLQLVYDGVVQPVEVVALDGVAVGSMDGTRRGRLITKTHIYLPPAARAEFIMKPPSADVHLATFRTLHIDTGPLGDSDTSRVLAVLKVVDPRTSSDNSNGAGAATSAASSELAAADASVLPTMPDVSEAPAPQRFEGLDAAPVATARTLYFSEQLFPIFAPPQTPSPFDSDTGGKFFITVAGQTPALFDPSAPPAIVTRQGSVEEWTIENHTQEVHIFHMHQIHFQLREINHVPVSKDDRQFLDTVQVPYWSGAGPYPSITVAMDFRGDIVGDFVYHCHILGHEDLGMMAIIRVLPRT